MSTRTLSPLEEHALRLLRASPEYVADAKVGAPLGNSVIGSTLSMTTRSPRQYAEEAVVTALRSLRRKP